MLKKYQITIVSIFLFLCSCKSKNLILQESEVEYILLEDTVTLLPIHHHYETMVGEKQCIYVPSKKIFCRDTLFFDLHIKNK